MSHEHESCTNPKGGDVGSVCNEGMLLGYCDWPECPNPDCMVIGHCDCKCHSGKTCGCGHTWPRMDKQVKT